MNFLIAVCQNPEILRVLYFARIILDIVLTVVPIGLILMLIVDFSKAVIAPSEEEAKKSSKLVGKRILYCALIFITPWIIDVLFAFLGALNLNTGGTNYADCLNNANSDSISYYQDIVDYEDKHALDAKQAEWKKIIEDFQKKKLIMNLQNGKTSTAPTYREAAIKMVDMAKNEMGNTHGSKYSGRDDSVAWCAYFTVWALKNTEIDGVGNVFDNVINKEGLVDNISYAGDTVYAFAQSKNLEFHYSKYYAKKHGKNDSYTPKKGDLIYFKWKVNEEPWDGTIAIMDHVVDHVGLVDNVVNGTIYTIEGNTGNHEVGTREISVDSELIIGYGSWYGNNYVKPGGNNTTQEIN